MDAQLLLSTLGTPAAICGASALLFGGAAIDRAWLWYQERAIARRLCESTRARVRSRNGAAAETRVLAAPVAAQAARHGAETGAATAQAAVTPRSAAPETRPDTWAAAAEDRGPVALERVHTPQSRLMFSTAHVLMSAQTQVAEFIEAVRANELGKNPESGVWECQRTDKGWVSAYHAWARKRGIVAVHADIFLREFARSAGVIKLPRKRLKDPATGNVIKLPSGSPARATYYVLRELLPEAQPVRRRRAA